jgi:hypothetical protein
MITIKNINKAVFKQRLAEKTECTIQYNGWCCGGCFYSIDRVKLTNQDWNALLIYRGDYNLEECNKIRKEEGEIPLTIEMIKDSIIKIWELIK